MAAATNDSSNAPNLFTLTSRRLSVSIALSGIAGRPSVTYHDESRALSFTGDEITFEDSQLGRLVSVVIVRTVDLGDTTFTVLLPQINLTGASSQIETLGITALHRTTIGGIGHGQLTSYSATRLRGTASQVEF